ncbi:MAG: hypothetical protein JSW38_08935 [Dehalococcoidia bacterium]|nr:MAG: hypothetical protein JSW38_08935 [Dehalococcoidia bacterium]
MDQYKGSYYLGSTAPDIRLVMSASREETHFLSLESEEGASGVNPLFKLHPKLKGNANVSAATRAFVAGYLSHLVTDEAWIYRIFRPFFGALSPLGGGPVANLYDRVLQFELDQRERANNSSMSRIRKELMESTSGVEVDFIDPLSLERWREFVSTVATRQASWEDFRRFAGKYLIWMQQIASNDLDSFFSSFDKSLEQVMEIVPNEQLIEFREQSIADSVAVAREYLG